MPKTLARAPLALLLCLAAGAAGAASFDCAKARTSTEKAVCNDRALNDLDVQMVDYLEVIKPFEAMGASAARRDAQRDWLAARNRCGADRTCLHRLYQRRVGDLMTDYKTYANQYGPLGPGAAQ